MKKGPDPSEQGEGRMSSWWRILVAVGIFAGIGLFLNTLWTQTIGKPKADVDILLNSTSQVVSPGAPSEVEVFVNGQRVADAWVISLDLANTGDTVLHATDFTLPVGVKLKNGEFLTAPKRTGGSNPDLPVTVTSTTSTLGAVPAALNPGEKVSFYVISDTLPDLDAIGHVAGVSDISVIPRGSERSSSLITSEGLVIGSMVIVAAMGALMAGLLLGLRERRRDRDQLLRELAYHDAAHELQEQEDE